MFLILPFNVITMRISKTNKLLTSCLYSQDCYHKMIELSSEARRAYEVMVLSLEQTGQADSEQAVTTEEELQISSLAKEADASPDTTQTEEPEYSKLLSQANFGKVTVFYMN